MSTIVKKIAFNEQTSIPEGKMVAENSLSLINNLEVTCSVRLGTLILTVEELRQLKSGQTFALQQKTHEPVDILVNNQIIARGELMCCDDNFAIQIIEVCS